MAYRFIRKPSRNKFVRVFPSAKTIYRIVNADEKPTEDNIAQVVEETAEQTEDAEGGITESETERLKKRTPRRRRPKDNAEENNGEQDGQH